MQPETTGAVDTAPETTPSRDDMLLAVLEQISGQIKGLTERVEAIEQKPEPPRFIDPQVNKNTAAAERSRIAQNAPGDGIPRSKTIPIFPNGEKVPEMVMAQYAPKFGEGDLVLLDLEAVPHGRDDGKTRGQLMADAGVPNGYGEVFDRTFLSAQQGHGWKYRVKFDKSVMPGSNGGLVALYERELVKA